MSFPFNTLQGLIVVEAQLEGPTGSGALRLALVAEDYDRTGSSESVSRPGRTCYNDRERAQGDH